MKKSELLKWVEQHREYLELPRKERKAYEIAMAEERTDNSRKAVVISSISLAVACTALCLTMVMVAHALGWF